MATINNEEKALVSQKGSVFVVLTAACLCLSLLLAGCSSASTTSGDTAVQDGQAPYKSEEEMQEELNNKVEEGMLDISVASKITFENGTSEGVANIENVPGNIYDIKVAITLESTDEVVYETPLMNPNQYIEKIKLNRDLEAGEYEALATFTAYNQETGEEEGQAAAEIKIVVES